MDGIVRFATAMGGSGSVHIAWLSEVCERFVGGARKVRGELLYEVATSLPVDLPRIKRSVLFAQFSCPKDHIKDKLCEWVSSTELKTMAKKADWLERARACEIRMEEINKQHSLEKGTWSHLNHKDFQMCFARLECRTNIRCVPLAFACRLSGMCNRVFVFTRPTE